MKDITRTFDEKLSKEDIYMIAGTLRMLSEDKYQGIIDRNKARKLADKLKRELL